MTRGVIVGGMLIAGCAWSNSLYQARTLTQQAARAEHDHQPGEAATLWGTVVVKAESAYARAPRGKRGAEALWLAGQAEARMQDCSRAVPTLEGALFAGSNPPWRQQLLLDLGRCSESIGGPTAASVYAMLLASNPDSATRREARLRQGHVLVLQGHWTEGLAALGTDDSLPARLDRATALAQLGRISEALTDLEPMLAKADTSIRWQPFIEAFASHSSEDADSLLARLLAFRDVTAEQRAAWLLAGARAATEFDPAAADRRLARLAAEPAGRSVTDGQMLQMQLQVTRAPSVPMLRLVLDSLRHNTKVRQGGLAAVRLIETEQRAARLIAQSDSVRAGAHTGDLALFALAESARDSLGAPGVSAWFLGRLEREWPQSPYLPKALMARAMLEPDSAAILIARAERDSSNPYVRAASGDVGGRVRRARLEDSLGTFVRSWWASLPALSGVVQ